MRNPDLIPERDGDFAIFESNLAAKVSQHHAAWDIPERAILPLLQAQARWTVAWDAAKNKKNRTSAQVTEKKLARKTYEAVLRPFIQQWIIYRGTMTDSDRLGLGVKPRKKTRTRIPAPDTVPVVVITRASGNAVLLHFRRQAGDDGSNRRAFPKGMPYAEVALTVGAPPVSLRDFVPFATATRSPFRIEHMPQYRSKEIFVCARWRNTMGQVGGWSQVHSFVMG